jgi:hypothetical protein
MNKQFKIAWSKEPEKEDYRAAEKYLTLMNTPKVASEIVVRMRSAPIAIYEARDILRAAGVSMLGISASDEERKKILGGEKISPLLLVRDEKRPNVIIADGYHRLCTIYLCDEHAMVSCKIV